MKELFFAVAAIAAQNPHGFTISLETLEPVKNGYCIALAETQNSFGAVGLEKVLTVAQQKNTAVGGWYDSKSGLYYYDAVIVCDSLEDALLLGKLNNQIAIFDLNAKQEIRL